MVIIVFISKLFDSQAADEIMGISVVDLSIVCILGVVIALALLILWLQTVTIRKLKKNRKHLKTQLEVSHDKHLG